MVLFRRDGGRWNAYRKIARGGLAALAIAASGHALSNPVSQDARDKVGAPKSGREPSQEPQPSQTATLHGDAQRIAAALESRNRYEQSPDSQKEAHAAAEAAKDAATWAMLLFFTSVAETVVTAIGVMLVFFTLKEARRSATEAKRGADEAKRSADAAHASLIETRSGERAWVMMGRTHTGINHASEEHFFQMIIVWNNFGRTPARRFTFLGGGESYPMVDEYTVVPEIVIGPGGNTWTDTIVHIPLRGAFEERRTYTFRCKVTYFDIFEDIERHSEVVLQFRYIGQVDPRSVNPRDEFANKVLSAGAVISIISHTAD